MLRFNEWRMRNEGYDDMSNDDLSQSERGMMKEVENLRTLLKQSETQLEQARSEVEKIRADRDRIAINHDENIYAERRLTRESVLAELRGRIKNVLNLEFEEAERFASNEDERDSLRRLGEALREITLIS